MENPRRYFGTGLLALAFVLILPTVGVAANENEADVSSLIGRGEASFVANCASCHGLDGRGDGSVAEYLTVKPSDLTKLAGGNAGEFPFDDVYQIVDGRPVASHGSREMPVWGPAFKGMDETSSKQTVKEKIVELVYYLKSIQGSTAE
jgi:mono/diheme cytochrome c family protein